VKHWTVEATIRENDAVSGRRPFLGDCQARVRTPVAIDVGIDENDDKGRQGVSVSEGRLDHRRQTPSRRIQGLPSLIFWIHSCVLELTIIPPRESPIHEENDREAATRSTAAR
jgi:hypothetical protein